MNIINLEYFNEKVGSGRYGSLDDPYIQNLENKSQISKDLRWKTDYLWLRWIFINNNNEKKIIEIKASGMCQAVLDVKNGNEYVVAVFGSTDWPWPANAAVFNADGSMRGKITPPTGLTPKPIEGISSVQIKNGEVLICCYYNHDRLVYIEFDPETMQWGRVDHLGGRA